MFEFTVFLAFFPIRSYTLSFFLLRFLFISFFVEIVRSLDQDFMSELPEATDLLNRFFDTLFSTFQSSLNYRGEWSIISMNYALTLAQILGAQQFQSLYQPKVMDLLSFYVSSILNTSSLRKILSITLKVWFGEKNKDR